MRYFYILVYFLLSGNFLFASNGFVASKIIKKENVSAEKMIVYSYIAFFILLLGYVLFISRKISLVNKKLTKLELLHDKEE